MYVIEFINSIRHNDQSRIKQMKICCRYIKFFPTATPMSWIKILHQQLITFYNGSGRKTRSTFNTLFNSCPGHKLKCMQKLFSIRFPAFVVKSSRQIEQRKCRTSRGKEINPWNTGKWIQGGCRERSKR